MAAIRSNNTKPELQVRRALHAAGFRYRLHARDLPGRPDVVLTRWRAVVFIHGCYWHRHDCHLFRWPATREDFWRAKIGRNVENDAKANAALREAGWRVATVWECGLKGRTRPDFGDSIRQLAAWIRSDAPVLTIRGN